MLNLAQPNAMGRQWQKADDKSREQIFEVLTNALAVEPSSSHHEYPSMPATMDDNLYETRGEAYLGERPIIVGHSEQPRRCLMHLVVESREANRLRIVGVGFCVGLRKGVVAWRGQARMPATAWQRRRRGCVVRCRSGPGGLVRTKLLWAGREQQVRASGEPTEGLARPNSLV